MNDSELKSPAEIKRFLDGSQAVKLNISKEQRCAWIARLLKRTRYFDLNFPQGHTCIFAYFHEIGIF